MRKNTTTTTSAMLGARTPRTNESEREMRAVDAIEDERNNTNIYTNNCGRCWYNLELNGWVTSVALKPICTRSIQIARSSISTKPAIIASVHKLTHTHTQIANRPNTTKIIRRINIRRERERKRGRRKQKNNSLILCENTK